MWNRNRKLYRWWHGGTWVFMNGLWWHANKDGYICERADQDGPYHSFHITFAGIEFVEVYK